MPRVHHVKKARKDNPVCKAGESYYWWKFAFGSKRYSLTRPRSSQLTQSEFYSELFLLKESLEDTPVTGDDLRDWREGAIGDLENLSSDCYDKRSNMPDSLQDSPTGELLENRACEVESLRSELENVDLEEPEQKPLDEMSEEELEILDEFWEEKKEELFGCNWTIE